MNDQISRPSPSTTSTPRTPLSLLSLPPEIRITIYTHLFTPSILSLEPPFPTPSHCRPLICPCRFPHALISTCRLLRQEALPYLLASTTLHLSSPTSALSLLPPHYLAAIPHAVVLSVKQYLKAPLDFSRLGSLRVLELRNIAVWCQYLSEEALWDAEGDRVMLDLAMFNVKRHSADLARLCASVERPFRILLGCRFVVASVRTETLDAVLDVDRQAVVSKSRGCVITERNTWAGFY